MSKELYIPGYPGEGQYGLRTMNVGGSGGGSPYSQTGALVSSGTSTQLYNSNFGSFGMEVGQTTMLISFWAYFTNNSVTQYILNFKESSTDRFLVNFVKDGAGFTRVNFTGRKSDGTGQSMAWELDNFIGQTSAIDSNGLIKTGEWHWWCIEICGDPNQRIYIDGTTSLGQGQNPWYQYQGEYASLSGYMGGTQTLPLTTGGMMSQLRFHNGWTDRATFLASDKWHSRIGSIDSESELYAGWRLEEDGTEYTGTGFTFIGGNGTFDSESGPLLLT